MTYLVESCRLTCTGIPGSIHALTTYEGLCFLCQNPRKWDEIGYDIGSVPRRVIGKVLLVVINIQHARHFVILGLLPFFPYLPQHRSSVPVSLPFSIL